MKSTLLALALLSTIGLPPLLSQQDSGRTSTYSLPGLKGAVEMQMGPLSFEGVDFRPGGDGLKVLAKDDAGLVMTLFLEKAPRKGTSRDCRDDWWNKTKKSSPFKMEDLKLSDDGEMARADYFIREFKGQEINQKVVHAYLTSDEVWVEIHLSKTGYRPTEPDPFASILSTVRMIADYTPGTMDYVQYGSLFYRDRNYAKAATWYQQALDLEKKESKLDVPIFRVLVDNLGMSYGISGNLQQAKDTFDYGLSRDPTYPLFYYNLACTYAEMNDLDRSLTYLKKAYEHRENVIKGEAMPDPRKDDSFNRFLSDERFKQTVAALPGLAH
jgi:tetratricopeptide (TPR) repeat protein